MFRNQVSFETRVLKNVFTLTAKEHLGLLSSPLTTFTRTACCTPVASAQLWNVLFWSLLFTEELVH